jgi:hypothetical protein
VHEAGGVIPQSLMRSLFMIEPDVFCDRRASDLLCGVCGIAVDLLLLDGAIPSLLPGIVCGPIGPTGGEHHLQIPDKPLGLPGHIWRTLIGSKDGFWISLLNPFAEVGQGQEILNLSLSDRFDDSPGNDVPREVVDDGQEVIAIVGDAEDGPVFTPDLVGTERFIVRNFPWGFSEFLVQHPTQGLKDAVTARWADPEPIVSQRPTDLAMGQLSVGFLLIDDRLFFVNRKRQGRGFSLGSPTLLRPFVVGGSANPQSFQDLGFGDSFKRKSLDLLDDSLPLLFAIGGAFGAVG